MCVGTITTAARRAMCPRTQSRSRCGKADHFPFRMHLSIECSLGRIDQLLTRSRHPPLFHVKNNFDLLSIIASDAEGMNTLLIVCLRFLRSLNVSVATNLEPITGRRSGYDFVLWGRFVSIQSLPWTQGI
jgi:hypothetical protein